MSNHDTAALDGIKRKPVAMRADAILARRKPLAEDLKRAIGRAIERGIVLSGLTKQDVSFQMGYEDASALSRWISGTETPQFARLFMVLPLRAGLVIALAELAEGVAVTTTITIQRRA